MNNMQKQLRYNIVEYLSAYKKRLSIIFLFFALLLFAGAIYFNKPFLYALPFTILVIFLFILKIEMLYFLMLFVIPFSIEYDFSNSIIDLPSEPLLILFAILFGIYCLLNYKKVQEKININPLIYFIALHLIWTYFSTIFSTNIIVSIKTSIVKTLYVLVFYLGTALFIHQFKKIKKLIWALWGPTFLTIVYALIIHSTYNFSFESINKALHPIYRNHVNYGVFITMLFPFLIFLNRQCKAQTIPKLFSQISIPITLVAIYFTYTRGAWLGLLIMPIYYIVLKLRWTKSILIIVSFIILSFGSYLFYNNNYQKFAPNFSTTIYHDKLSAHLNSTFEMEDMSTVERFYRWLASIKMSKENLIYGVGPGNFTDNYKPYTVASYQTYISENEEKSTVHNYFLLMLAEQGLVGLIIYTAFVFYLLMYIEKLYHTQINKEYKIAVLLIACSILAFLFNNTLSDFLETNKVGSLFWINIGLLTIFSNPIKENEH